MSLDLNNELKLTIDMGIVLLPNKECKDLSNSITNFVATSLPKASQITNKPHITLIHIANQDNKGAATLKETFVNFYHNNTPSVIKLPNRSLDPKDLIKARGGNSEIGYKWMDMDFHVTPALKELRNQVTTTFCPLHQGVLTRMNDNENNFIEGSQAKKDIDECGVTFTNYTPHITTWYVDIPKENKVKELNDIASSITPKVPHAECYAEHIALVELGRNGQATKIIESFPLSQETSNTTIAPVISTITIVFLVAYLVFRYNKKKK
jgi:2'-5' RNA ligase